MCDKLCKRLLCLHEQAFAGQWAVNGFTVSCPVVSRGLGEGKLPLADS